MFVQLLAWIVVSYIQYLLQPKPEPPEPGKVEIPTVEEGRKVGILFGTRWIKSSHIFWWGDVKTTPIRAEGGKK